MGNTLFPKICIKMENLDLIDCVTSKIQYDFKN